MPQPIQRTTTVTDASYMLKLNKSNSSSSELAGTDGIVLALFQQEVNHLMTHLCHILRACLAKQYIPKAWRQVKVTFIPKHRKVNYTEAKAYHPMSVHAENDTKICGQAYQGGDMGATSPTSTSICLETKEVH